MQKRSSAGYTTRQLSPAPGALSGISGRDCWGGEESHYPGLANALLFFGACCCWELDLISHCRKCLPLLGGEGGELIQANVGTNPPVKAGPDPGIGPAKEHVSRNTKPSPETGTAHLSSLTKKQRALTLPGTHALTEKAKTSREEESSLCVSSLPEGGEEATGTF